MKIKTQLLLLLGVFAVSIFLIVGVNIFSIVSSTQQHQMAYAEMLIGQSETYIQLYLQRIDRIASQLQNTYTVQKFFLAPKWSGLIDAEQELAPTARSVLDQQDGISGLLFIGPDRRVNYSAQEDCFVMPEEEINSLTYTNLYQTDDAEYYYCIIPINSTMEPYVTLRKIGYVVMELDPDFYSSVFRRYLPSENATFILTDGNRNIVASNSHADSSLRFAVSELLSGKNFQNIEGTKYLCIVNQIQELGYQISYFLPYSDILFPGMRLAVINFAVFAGFFLLCMVLAVMMIRGILTPIRQISAFAHETIYNRRKSSLQITVRNELLPMVESLNWMLEQKEESTRKIFETQQKLYEAEKAEKQAKLDSLQAQIHPHFLYNTLECIRSIAEAKGVQEISEISSAMAKMFRYSIGGDPWSTLAEELEIVKAYFRIISIRFRGKYRLSLQCPAEYGDCRMIRMILQPLVENAVIHGLEKRRGEGEVNIRCEKTDGFLYLWVSDNGKGIEKEELEQIREQMEYPVSDSSVGIFNTVKRLKNRYGKEAKLEIDSVFQEGTVIFVCFPYREE